MIHTADDSATMKVLLTGGLGYIGSHVAAHLAALSHRDALRADHESAAASSSSFSHVPNVAWENVEDAGGGAAQRYELHIVDIAEANTAAATALATMLRRTNTAFTFHHVDIRDADALRALFGAVRPDCVVHLAALKSVSDSIRAPLEYYHTNVQGTHNLLCAMRDHQCFHLVFSSSSAVYGSAKAPYDEDRTMTGVGITNPYGRTKIMAEQIIADVVRTDARWRAIALRYFNPIGAHPSGQIGECVGPRSAGLVPSIVRSLKHGAPFSINGTDYVESPDGTPVRDFLHIMDLAEAHRAAIALMFDRRNPMHERHFETINLGTGQGFSVQEVLRCMERIANKPLRVMASLRRPGDLPLSISSVRKAAAMLQWRTNHGLEDMCRDVLRFHNLLPTQNTDNYE